LEVLIVGAVVRTIIEDTTVESVAVLGLIVIVRVVLSFSLEVEIDGAWPWNLWRVKATKDDAGRSWPGRNRVVGSCQLCVGPEFINAKRITIGSIPHFDRRTTATVKRALSGALASERHGNRESLVVP
jgi:hypothetical protein